MATITGWDKGGVYYSDFLSAGSGTGSGGAGDVRLATERELQRKCDAFLENFRIDNQFIYR